MADLSAPTPISPIGAVPPGFAFRASLPDGDPADPVDSVRIQVREVGVDTGPVVWSERFRPPPRGWPAGECRADNPGQPMLLAHQAFRWRVRTRTAAGVQGPWMDWQPFTIERAAPVVSPTPAGRVALGVAPTLRAGVTIPKEASAVLAHEIELALRAADGSVDWTTPLHRVEGGALPAGPGVAADPVPPLTIRFETLDGRPAVPGMVVGDRKPFVRLAAGSRVRAYHWRSRQFGHVFHETPDARPETRGISDDGRCITFRIGPALARQGDPGRGWFVPPFEPGQDGFRGSTYGPNVVPANPLGHRAYAVDFNRGSGTDDRGLPVHPAAPGVVARIVEDDGTVYVEHWDRRLATQYTHMVISPQLAVGKRVDLATVLGRIDATGLDDPAATHLHHRHFRVRPEFPPDDPQARRWYPVQMRFGRIGVRASCAGPRDPDRPLDDWRSDRGVTQSGFHGWKVDPDAVATIAVSVTWDETGARSEWMSLAYAVATSAASAPAGVDPGCQEAAGGFAIEHAYAGPALAAGRYAIRYRCRDDQGDDSRWAIDDTLEIGG